MQESRATIAWAFYPGGSAGHLLKLVFLFLEQDVERGHGTVAARDVLLQLHFFAVGKLFVAVDFLLQHAEVVPHHHDFVEKGFEGTSLGCNAGRRGA